MQSTLEADIDTIRPSQQAERFGQGGGMPDMNEMMNDPQIRQMAEQFGRSRGAGGSGGSNNNPDMYS